MVLVLGLLVGGFVIFLSLQTETDTRSPTVSSNVSTRPTVSTPPVTQPNGESVLGSGEEVWIQQFDRETGDLTSEFRAARYDPPQNGVVHVILPEARFYTRDGQVLTISARSGEVVMPEQTRKTDRLDSIQGAPPSRGTLYDVFLGVLETPDDNQPSLTCRVPVVAFDYDSLTLYTIQTEIDGRIVPADRVPVTIRGAEYDFDGQGLAVRWNQRDQRLEHLQIEHGGRLVVKRPGALGHWPMSFRESSTGPDRFSVNEPLDIQLVQADPVEARRMSAEEAEIRRQKRLAAARRAAQETSRSPRELVAYRASFLDSIAIHESDRLIGSADRMIMTFTLGKQTNDDAPASTQPQTQPHSIRPSTTRQMTESKPPPHIDPIQITWTGPLTVVPLKYDESGLRAPDDRSVRFEGSPVRLERDGNQIQATSITAASVGERFSAKGSTKDDPVVLKNADGTTLRTPQLDIVGTRGIVQGNSQADMIFKDPQGQPQTLTAIWTDSGTIDFRKTDNGLVIQQASLAGQVRVQHPQLSLDGDKLKIAFAESANARQPELRQVEVSGSAKSIIKTPDRVQTIQAQLLQLGLHDSHDGKPVFDRLFARENVVFTEEGQMLSCDQLQASIMTRPSQKPQLHEMKAEGTVRYTGPNQTQAQADQLSVVQREGIQQITLRGRQAVIQDRQNRLTGSMIQFASDGTIVSVIGAGTLNVVANDLNTKPARPITLIWEDGFEIDSGKNIATVAGNVRMISDEADGSVYQALARRMIVRLVDNPSRTSSRLSDKSIESVSLLEDVEVSSLLKSANDPNTILRQTHLFVSEANLDVDGQGQLRSVSIPVGGRMLFENHDPGDTNQNVAGSEVQFRGAVGLQWSKSLTYTAASEQMIVDGDVVIVYEPIEGDTIRVLTRRLIADIHQMPETGVSRLEKVYSEGGTSVIGQKVRFDAAQAVYEPDSDRIVVRGTPRQPVEIFDESGLSSGTYEEIWWSLKENRPERLKNVTGNLRQ
jgi:lipopolysaccharide export system protein LptA